MLTDCPCVSWVRTPTDRLPMSRHHPNCENYVLEDFVRVSVDGAHCIMEQWEADDPEFDHPEYEKTPVQMTRDQFEALPEFEGF